MLYITGGFVLPRPGSTTSSETIKTLSAPSEASFTDTFGALLPPAQYLPTDKGKIAYYALAPEPDKTTTTEPQRVLLLHGVQTPALGMLPLTRALRAAHPSKHFLLVDLWGHGLTDTPIIPHTEALFLEAIDTLLDHLGWTTAHLVGYSLGSILTASYTASRRGRVLSAALVAPPAHFFLKDFTPEQQALLKQIPCPDEAAASKLVLETLEGGELVVPEDWRDRIERREVVAEAVRVWQIREHPGHMATVVAVLRDVGVMDREEAYRAAAGTGVPCLVVLGGSDDLTDEKHTRGLGFEDIVVVPNVGHAVVRQRVPEVSQAIANFWDKLPVRV
jgi:pimeloyl-ACP methyl ester carboxylesterase